MSSRTSTPLIASSRSPSENEKMPSTSASKKITNTGALLDEYQYDDEQTVDLLNAIRNWNLATRSPQSPDYLHHHHDHDGDVGSTLTSATSTIGTHTDVDTITTATSSKGFHSITKPPRTPLCNYSSRPSSLTSRILDAGTTGEKHLNTPSSSVKRMRMPLHLEKEDDSKLFFSKTASLSSSESEHESDNGSPGKDSIDTNPVDAESTSESIAGGQQMDQDHGRGDQAQELPQYVTMKEKHLSKLEQENAEAMKILRQTASVLGLQHQQMHSVLPTVQKLVKVITEHVPRLEQFVEEVCDVVENGNEAADNNVETAQNPNQKVALKRRRNRKNMEARKERMDSAVEAVKKKFEEEPANEQALQNMDEFPNDPANCDEIMGCSFHYEDYQSYGSFTTAVKEKLSRRRQSAQEFSLVNTPVSSNKDPLLKGNKMNSPVSLLTDNEALEEINRLIAFEERYHSRLNGIVKEEEDLESPSSSHASTSGPSQKKSIKSDTVTEDLLNADTTTLRRFVLHFAYLFSAKRDDILGKMNELYVYSHETNLIISDLKKAMDLPQNCPLHSVARKVIALIEDRQKRES